MELKIPKLAVSMQDGTLVEWLVADGARVEASTAIYRLETDKVETDVEAPAAGTIRLLAEPGKSYRVGTTIAEIVP